MTPTPSTQTPSGREREPLQAPPPRTTRRALLLGAAATLATPTVLRAQGMMDGMMSDGSMGGMDHGGMTGGDAASAPVQSGEPFRSLPLLDARGGTLDLRATGGETRFGGGAPTPTMGWGQAYLGPTIRIQRGTTVAASVANGTDVPISAHWHGLNVPSNADGGAPQSVIRPGKAWKATLPVEQPAATLWYHTHVHGRTAPDLWAGLAGAILLEDEATDALGLPSDHGVDDLVLILQDKRFDAEGRATYEPGMMEIMHGYVGSNVLANGQLAPVADVPTGLVRLRLVNAATSAEHRIAFDRPTVLIGVDQGLLPAPAPVEVVIIAPGERVEVVIDMGEGREASPTVVASTVGGGMEGMGGMMGDGMIMGGGEPHPLITLRADPARRGAGRVPERLADAQQDLSEPVATRRFVLQENMGPMQHVRRMVGRGPVMAINGEPYSPVRSDFTAKRGTVERWTVVSEDMAHPFHAHGVKFRVPDPRTPEETGWKDVVTVAGTRDLLVAIEAPSVDGVPLMFHCHILEHEDAGMMGQFLTS